MNNEEFKRKFQEQTVIVTPKKKKRRKITIHKWIIALLCIPTFIAIFLFIFIPYLKNSYNPVLIEAIINNVNSIPEELLASNADIALIIALIEFERYSIWILAAGIVWALLVPLPLQLYVWHKESTSEPNSQNI